MISSALREFNDEVYRRKTQRIKLQGNTCRRLINTPGQVAVNLK